GIRDPLVTGVQTCALPISLALGIDPGLRPLDALKAWMEKRKTLKSHAPAAVSTAAFLENTQTGEDVDVGCFPAPIWHARDGGPRSEERRVGKECGDRWISG